MKYILQNLSAACQTPQRGAFFTVQVPPKRGIPPRRDTSPAKPTVTFSPSTITGTCILPPE